MRWIIALMSLLACLMPWRAVLAEDVSAVTLLDALIERTPGVTLNRMRDRPEAFVQEAAGLILGYGGSDGLSAEDVETAIAAELARLRARELRRLLDADLNGDLSVSAEELDVLVGAASATMRGRLMVWHRASDLNRDGTASWTEIRAHARAVAEAGLSAQARAAMRAMMVFDLSGDGRVHMNEVLDAMDVLRPPA
ncbi:MAG: hypothetical protein AAF214_06910 [Pseudomonadota bacterium]